MFITEKRLRSILREELLRIFDPQPPDVLSLKDKGGGEVIMPNYVRQQFDEGKVTSLKDIL